MILAPGAMGHNHFEVSIWIFLGTKNNQNKFWLVWSFQRYELFTLCDAKWPQKLRSILSGSKCALILFCTCTVDMIHLLTIVDLMDVIVIDVRPYCKILYSLVYLVTWHELQLCHCFVYSKYFNTQIWIFSFAHHNHHVCNFMQRRPDRLCPYSGGTGGGICPFFFYWYLPPPRDTFFPSMPLHHEKKSGCVHCLKNISTFLGMPAHHAMHGHMKKLWLQI